MGRVTFGFDPDLDVAMGDALDAMVGWMQVILDVDKSTALALASTAVDLRITQVANQTWGVHALLAGRSTGVTSWPVETGVFELGDLPVERGGVIRAAELAWQTHGTLSPAKDNVIVYPCSYGATHETQDWLIGPDGVLDPERWFIVMPDMFSNGLSSSASSDPEFPSLVTMADNVHAQYRLLSEYFGITRLAAAYGFSMGAGQAYHWASLYPDMVERAIVVCGSARTSLHNRVFLTGLLSILEAAPEHLGNGRFSAEPVAAKRAFAHVYVELGAEPGLLPRTALRVAGRSGSRHLPADRLGGPLRREQRGRPVRASAHLARGRHQYAVRG